MITWYIQSQLLFSSKYFPTASLHSSLKQGRWAFIIRVQQIRGTERFRDLPKVTQVVLGGPQPRSLSLTSWPCVVLAALKGGGCRGVRGGDKEAVALGPAWLRLG